MTKLDQEDKDDIAAYYLSGRKITEIAEEKEIARSTVRRVLEDIGIYRNETEKQCYSCGKYFKPSKYSGGNQKFCSDYCRHLSFKGVKVVRRRNSKCIFCGKRFLIKNIGQKYCSKSCNRRHKNYISIIEKGPRYCVYCNEKFYGGSGKCCSDKCRKKYRNRQHYNRENKRLENARNNGVFDADIDIYKLIERDGPNCYICGIKTSFDLHYNDPEYPTIEHIIPIKLGGTHSWQNVKVACRDCNTKKSIKPLEEFMKGRG